MNAIPLCGTLRSVVGNGRAVIWARWRFRQADKVGPRVRLWGHARVVNRGRMVVGARTRFDGTQASLELVSGPGGVLEIGDRTYINFGTSVVATERITIGEDCLIGPYCSVMDNSYHHLDPERRFETPPSAPVTIGNNVWLGIRTIVLPGVSIGDDSVIGAGSVVSQDIPARSLAGGVPARIIRPL